MIIVAEPINDFDSNNDVGLCQVVPLANAAFAVVCKKEIELGCSGC